MTRSSLAAKKSLEHQHQSERTSPESSRQPGPDGPYADILALQRTAGNRAVSQFLGSTSSTPLSNGASLQRKCACGNDAMAGRECAECSKEKRSGLQTKLQVNEPGDSYEQEADRIADQVMATPAHHAVSGAPPRIQRFSAQPTGQTEAAPASVDQALASPGRPLEPTLRQDMEQRFGHDFSRVRVHSGAAAERSAREVNARAYTVGHNIVFGAGRYAPRTNEGRRLLAHELTHVVQQKNGNPQAFIQLDRAPGKKELPPENAPGMEGELTAISSDQYSKSSTFMDKGKISIDSSTKIIKTPDVVHTRKTPKGAQKLPYEFVLQHERRVEIETPSGDKAVLIIKADQYLPFDTLNRNPKMSPKKAISLPGDFCKLRWSLEGKYGTEKFKEALRREHGILPIETTVQGKTMESFLASSFSLDKSLKPENSRDPCSLKGIAEKNGPTLLYVNLTDRQQYQHIVDYLDGLLADRLKSEANLRKKLEHEKKKPHPPSEPKKRSPEPPADKPEKPPASEPGLHSQEELDQFIKNADSSLAMTADLVTDFIPYVNTAKFAVIAATGVNPVTGEKVGFWGRLLAGIFAIISLIPGADKFFRLLGRGLQFVLRPFMELGRRLLQLGGKLLRPLSRAGVVITTQLERFWNWLRGKSGGAARPALAGGIAMSPEAKMLAGEMDNLLAGGGAKTITVENVTFIDVEVTRQGRRLAISRYKTEVPHALRNQGLGRKMEAAFEEAAVAVARMNGLKTVTINVGKITNPGWREVLEQEFKYVPTRINTPEGPLIDWIKTITLE